MAMIQKEIKETEKQIAETDDKVNNVTASRNEYFDLVRKMVDENTDLKNKIQEADRSPNDPRNGDPRQQRAMQEQLDHAVHERARVEESTVRQYQSLAKRVGDIAMHLEQSTRGGNGSVTPRDIANELLALREGARAMLPVQGRGGNDRFSP